ncbi:phosphatidylinositol 3,5-bisphosphate 5-phosphatase, partial [Tremellales sp. Uapishka_1]
MDDLQDNPSTLNSLSKFTLFETKSRFYITASTASTHRVLKIDRTDPTVLSIVEDSTTYDSAELDLLLRMVQDGNKSQGGLEKVLEFHVSEPLATPFGMHSKSHPISDYGAGYGGYTSFVQYRGSIPVMWHQESSQMTPRPPIEISVKDPFYTPAAKHFDDLLGRYGPPIYILNLIKAKETVPRESKLLFEYGQCVAYLNQFLPEDKKMVYIPWDMSQAAKTMHQDVMGILEDICEESIHATNFFHGGPARNEVGTGPHREHALLQRGILRVNCVDCLDRTNAAQFAIAKRAFGHQLYALGMLSSPYLPFACDAVDVLTEMYHDHGDTLAWQYTGSALVNRVDTYRRIKAAQWSSHSRDLLENIRRFYNNSMLDADKQAAINLFLGVQPSSSETKISRPHYRQWFTPAHLASPDPDVLAPINQVFKEYYKPHILSQFARLYAFTMNSTTRFTAKPKNEILASPFESRVPLELASPTAAVSKPRTAARRWATPVDVPGAKKADPSHPQIPEESQTPPLPSKDPHPIDLLVRALLDPPDIEQRISEYDWSVVFSSIPRYDLLSSNTLEPLDLQLYAKTARLSNGHDVDVLLEHPGEVQRDTREKEKEKEKENDHDHNEGRNLQFYENWLKT